MTYYILKNGICKHPKNMNKNELLEALEQNEQMKEAVPISIYCGNKGYLKRLLKAFNN